MIKWPYPYQHAQCSKQPTLTYSVKCFSLYKINNGWKAGHVLGAIIGSRTWDSSYSWSEARNATGTAVLSYLYVVPVRSPGGENKDVLLAKPREIFEVYPTRPQPVRKTLCSDRDPQIRLSVVSRIHVMIIHLEIMEMWRYFYRCLQSDCGSLYQPSPLYSSRLSTPRTELDVRHRLSIILVR